MLNIKSSSCRDNSVHQIMSMMHINIVELKTSDNQLGFSGIKKIIDPCDLSCLFTSAL